MSMVTYPLNNIEYTAEDAELFHSTRTSGVYATDSFDYSVTGSDNSIVIGTGIAWIKNRQFSGKVVAQKEPMSLDMGLPDPTYPRIDAVVIQFNSNKNATEIVVKNGAASSFPIAPEVVRTESLYELHLYHVRREAGSLSISAPNITDLRNNNAYCGLMSDSITQAVDSTLSKNGVAADAAAVGNALAKKAPAGYGLGGTNGAVVTDANNATNNGWYTVYNGGTNLPGTSFGGSIHVKAFPVNNIIQHLYYTGHGDGECRRICTDGTWGEWEFVTPPLYAGVEYRTTERYDGKAVYTKLLDCGTVTNGKAVNHGVGSGLIRMAPVCSGILSTSINNQADDWEWVVSADQTAVRMTCGSGIAGNAMWKTQIWYTKD